MNCACIRLHLHRVFACTDLYLVVQYFDMSLSLKFHKDPSFRCGDILKFHFINFQCIFHTHMARLPNWGASKGGTRDGAPKQWLAPGIQIFFFFKTLLYISPFTKLNNWLLYFIRSQNFMDIVKQAKYETDDYVQYQILFYFSCF